MVLEARRYHGSGIINQQLSKAVIYWLITSLLLSTCAFVVDMLDLGKGSAWIIPAAFAVTTTHHIALLASSAFPPTLRLPIFSNTNFACSGFCMVLWAAGYTFSIISLAGTTRIFVKRLLSTVFSGAEFLALAFLVGRVRRERKAVAEI